MAKRITITKVAGWVFVDDEGVVHEVSAPAEAPADATVFRLRSVPIDARIYMGMAENSRERSEAIADMVRGAIGDWRGVLDDDEKEVPFSRDLLNEIPPDVLVPIGMHVVAKGAEKTKESEARRGNEPSGSSRATKSSGGTRTPGPRTASPATS